MCPSKQIGVEVFHRSAASTRSLPHLSLSHTRFPNRIATFAISKFDAILAYKYCAIKKMRLFCCIAFVALGVLCVALIFLVWIVVACFRCCARGSCSQVNNSIRSFIHSVCHGEHQKVSESNFSLLIFCEFLF